MSKSHELVGACLCIIGLSHCVHGRDDTRDILDRTAAQLNSIQTIELQYLTAYDELVGPGIEVFEGKGVISRWAWSWDRPANSQYQRGTYAIDLRRHVERFIYQEEWFTFDGRQFRSFIPAMKTGTIQPIETSAFEKQRGPLHLVGFQLALAGRLAHLPDLLVTRRNDWHVRALGPSTNKWQLSLPLEMGPFENKYFEYLYSRTLEVTVDASRGHIPVRIAIINPNTKLVHFENLVDELLEALPGIWVPVAGSRCEYLAGHVEPPDLTKDQADRMTPEQKIELARTLPTESRPLYLGKQHYRVDKKSIRANEPINRSKFTIDFPDGSSVWDDIAKKEIIFGKRGAPSSPPAPLRL